MRILLAISEMPPTRSGISRVGQRLYEGFTSADHTVHVLSTQDTKRLTLGELRLTGLLPRWPRLRKKLDDVDIVSLHGPAPTFSDALLVILALRKRHGVPRTVYTHAFDIDLPSMRPLCSVYNWMYRQFVRLADHVVVASASHALSFASPTSSDRVSVIPWGVECPVAALPTDKSRRFTVLFVGQLRSYKSVHTLIQAAQRIPEARVVIVGQGSERPRLERLTEELDVRNVEFMGSVSDEELWALYRSSHSVVLPSVSRMEAFGIVLLEGMAAGCVPVATALPGVMDVVGEAGFTYPPGDSAALGDILATLAHDDGGWHQLSQIARERSRQYTWDRTVRSYLNLFEAVGPASTAEATVDTPAHQ